MPFDPIAYELTSERLRTLDSAADALVAAVQGLRYRLCAGFLPSYQLPGMTGSQRWVPFPEGRFTAAPVHLWLNTAVFPPTWTAPSGVATRYGYTHIGGTVPEGNPDVSTLPTLGEIWTLAYQLGD